MQHFSLTVIFFLFFTFLKHIISLILLTLYLRNCTVHSTAAGVIFVVFPVMELAAVLGVNSFSRLKPHPDVSVVTTAFRIQQRHLQPKQPVLIVRYYLQLLQGLYPESHGIVDNKMYDVSLNAFFSLKTEEKFNSKWYQGEPVSEGKKKTRDLKRLTHCSYFRKGSVCGKYQLFS